MKVAEPKNLKGLFHEKIGIFRDENNNVIAINGSNNETGSAVIINNESFNTFCSWKPGQLEYIEQHINDFETYWLGKNENIILKELEDSIHKETLQIFDSGESMNDLFAILHEDNYKYSNNSYGFTPYQHQKIAVDKWLEKKQEFLNLRQDQVKLKQRFWQSKKLKSYMKGYIL